MSWLRQRRRRKLLGTPFPEDWLRFLRQNVGHYHRLPAPMQESVRNISRILTVEKIWEGCAGLVVTDEMKITISAQAALLLLGFEHDYYQRVTSILVYPKAFRTAREEAHADSEYIPGVAAEGQAVYRGPVILSWEEVLEQGRKPKLGHNVVIHEFAHQIDFLDNSVDGVPPLESPRAARRWKKVMYQALEKHRELLDHRQRSIFSVPAAESMVEFFAYSSEAFYCRPYFLALEFPEVFDLLKEFYRVDTRDWLGMNDVN